MALPPRVCLAPSPQSHRRVEDHRYRLLVETQPGLKTPISSSRSTSSMATATRPTRTERPVSGRAPLSTAWLARHAVAQSKGLEFVGRPAGLSLQFYRLNVFIPVRPRVCWASNAGSDLHVGDRIAFGVAGSDMELCAPPRSRGCLCRGTSWLQQRMNDDQLGFLRAVFTVLDSSVVHCPCSMDTSTAKVRSRLPTRKTTIASESDRPLAKPR